MSNMNPHVDLFIAEATSWQDILRKLRIVLLDCGLAEELKWGKPCYMFRSGNIVVLQPFKACCAILFMKGVLLKDPDNILVKTGENTRVGRQLRFKTLEEVEKMQTVLQDFVYQAIEIEKAGIKVEPEEIGERTLPAELLIRLKGSSPLKAAFEALTPGRQKGYIIYFSEPKQAITRQSRIEKCIPKILDGKGLTDF